MSRQPCHGSARKVNCERFFSTATSRSCDAKVWLDCIPLLPLIDFMLSKSRSLETILGRVIDGELDQDDNKIPLELGPFPCGGEERD
jgi:hypothetical protein